jgi:hypothetical protein
MREGIDMHQVSFPIVAVPTFVEATRDTGYKNTAAAIAELVDNAFEARACTVSIRIEEIKDRGANGLTITVTDDGIGMTPDVLQKALQFGGSTRFGSRMAAGRFGMGLPNGCLSQARRFDVFTWTRPSEVWSSYLDVDEIASGRLLIVPRPRSFKPAALLTETKSGTVVALTKCDRLDCRRLRPLQEKLRHELGRIFRKFLYAGKKLLINGQALHPLDPLFLQEGQNLTGAADFGPPLEYLVRVPGVADAVSTTVVYFSELPVELWHKLSNEEKNRTNIAKHAGGSIVRANREIDHGWYFMGSKRKENYDDWWRCEVNFGPELDELFGVTHSKQKINPTEALSAILEPEMERAARELNSRIRRKYAFIRQKESKRRPIQKLEARDYLLEPPSIKRGSNSRTNALHVPQILRRRTGNIDGLSFRISYTRSHRNSFYELSLKEGRLDLVLNESHPFFSSIYHPLETGTMHIDRLAFEHVLALLFAAALAECSLED